MGPKRKSRIKSDSKQRKKLKQEEEDSTGDSKLRLSFNSKPISVVKCAENTTGISGHHIKLPKAQSNTVGNTGTIISYFRKQKQEEAKTVSCPVCERMVLYRKINEHLDRGCSEEFLVPSKNMSSSSQRFGARGDQNRNTDSAKTIKHCKEPHLVPLMGGHVNNLDRTTSTSNGATGIAGITCTTTGSTGGFSANNMNHCDGTRVPHASSVDGHLQKPARTCDSIGMTTSVNSALYLSLDQASVDSNNSSMNICSNKSVASGSSPRGFKASTTHASITNVSSPTVLGKTCSRNLSSNYKLQNSSVNGIHNPGESTNDDHDTFGIENDDDDDELIAKVNIDQSLTDSSNVYQNIATGPTNNQAKTMTEEDIKSSNLHEPYYLQNFMLTLNTVLSHKDDSELFDENDNAVVELFNNLSVGAKKLYVRLFQRKFKWFQKSKIQYPRIGEDLQPFFQELIDSGFVQAEANLYDLQEILKLLPASDIQELAKSMHVINKNGGQSKKQLMQTLIKHSKRQCSLFANNGDRIAKAIIKRAKALLGPCVKLESFPRNVFSRFLLLFTLNLLADDDDNVGSQLSALFLINIGRVVYPSYQISRETPIFCSRDELIRYELANQDLYRMEDAMENKNFAEARNVYENVRVQFNESLRDLANGEQRLVNSVKLPIHLRRFTCTWLYTKMCSRGVELLQRDKDYTGAVELLRQLLGQNEFCVSRRGWWWERLALNLDQHLKRPAEALNAVREGLSDVRVRTGHRFALEQRAKKICDAKRNSSLRQHLTEISFTELKQPTVVTISGKRLSNEPVFVLHEVNADGSIDDNVVSYCSVEEMALRYYRQHGYNEGIHGEGSTFNTLFGLLMWDVIFAEGIPDVFRTPFQAAPLDIYCDNFYENRKEIIDQRLNEIGNASVEELTSWIECTWEEQQGKTCVGINWDLFSGVEQIKELAGCIGTRVLAGICGRFAKDYRHTRSGLPDLVVWNSSTSEYKIVEVKGPNDRLSTKQHVWLDVLVSLGVDAELLYVKGLNHIHLV